jgi:hypothetical protein
MKRAIRVEMFFGLGVCGRYLHNNGNFIRIIDAIEGNTVYWHDECSPGTCWPFEGVGRAIRKSVLANLRRGKRITKKAYAGRGQKTKWEIQVNMQSISSCAVQLLLFDRSST